MSDENPSLGWLGTGRLGAALADRLINAGQRVTSAPGCGTRISCRSTTSRPAAPG